jgi:ferrous iron transport protein B
MDTTSPSGVTTPAPSSSISSDGTSRPVVALAGNPNSGKTSVFNALTGLRRRVGNYPGVTVERVEASLALPDGRAARLIDLPGCYSLYPRSEDERVARNVLIGLDPRVPRPEVVVVVVDASALERNLYFATQMLEIGTPVVIALTMVDVAERRGLSIDPDALAAALHVPVVPVMARTGAGIDRLRATLERAAAPGRVWSLSEEGERVLDGLTTAVRAAGIVPPEAAEGEALRLLLSANLQDPYLLRGGPALGEAVRRAQEELDAEGIDRPALEAECRYGFCRAAATKARHDAPPRGPSRSERVDRVLAHRVLGPAIFLAVMGALFLAVFTWAEPFMGWIEDLTTWMGGVVSGALGPGMFTDLLVDGVIAGVGNVLVFLPQICILFLLLGLMEDVGYLARAAFLIDRPMRAAGLSGKAFVPLLSSFACAVPGIMSTRTIANRRDRFVTILVAPLMSCSARLPVYSLLIGAFVPRGYRTVTLLGLYTLSVTAALGVAWVLRRTIFRGEASTFILELPSYRLPSWRNVFQAVKAKAWVFTRQAGTIILAISIVLWFLAYFPRNEGIQKRAETRIARGEDPLSVRNEAAGAQLQQSFAGRMGHAIAPVIRPLGYDWKTGVGLIGSFAAREVMVSTMGVVYSVGEADETSKALRERMRADRRPDGTPVHTLLSSISLLVFFVLACQCMSTLAVAKRETNSWRWPLFMFGYMTVLAYVASLLVYQGGLLLGWGP